MTERTRNFWVGVTSLFGILGLAFMLLLFGYVPDLIRGGYSITVELPSASGLHEGGIVTFRGIEVGQVKSVQLNQPPDPGVLATLNINEDIRLPANVYAVLEGSVFGTSARLALHADGWNDNDGPPQTLATDGSAVITGTSASAAQTFDQLSLQLTRLTDEWVEVGANLNALIEPRNADAVDAGDVLGNASTVLARLDKRLAELEEVMAGVDRYVNDPQMYADFQAAAANARQLTGKLNEQLPEDIAALRTRYLALADDLNAAITTLRQSLDATRRGDNTVGKLLTDPTLYDNMNDSFERLQTALDELRLLLEKWKAEGLPVQF